MVMCFLYEAWTPAMKRSTHKATVEQIDMFHHTFLHTASRPIYRLRGGDIDQPSVFMVNVGFGQLRGSIQRAVLEGRRAYPLRRVPGSAGVWCANMAPGKRGGMFEPAGSCWPQ